ncbi:hypothetical protein MTY59_45000 [Mycobacterium senriense]|uniref:Uncharacterized protein n=1 Tax=Mycobacterium senriense TaxID=2775496 RepID=A0ABM7SW47_9MYCO|nr:hypothetical protein MTY59_45000 [Mycobacterium senriense]
MVEVHRRVDAAGLGDGPPRDHQFGGPAHRHAYGALRAHAGVDEHPRQPGRPLVEFAVRQFPAAVDHRRPVRGDRQRPGQQLRRHPDRCRDTGARQAREHQSALAAIQQLDRRQPLGGIGGHRHQDALESLEERLDAGGVEDVGVVFDVQAELAAGQCLDRQRVVVVLPVGELGDGQAVGAQRHAALDGVILVDEQRVEELIVAGDPMDLAEREVLVLERVVVAVLQLRQQFCGGGGRGDVGAHRHRVDQQAHHLFGIVDLQLANAGARGTEDDIVLTGQRGQHQRPGGLQDGADRGVAGARQLAKGLRGLLGHPGLFEAPSPLAQPVLRSDQAGGFEAEQHLPPGFPGGVEVSIGQPGEEGTV